MKAAAAILFFQINELARVKLVPFKVLLIRLGRLADNLD